MLADEYYTDDRPTTISRIQAKMEEDGWELTETILPHPESTSLGRIRLCLPAKEEVEREYRSKGYSDVLVSPNAYDFFGNPTDGYAVYVKGNPRQPPNAGLNNAVIYNETTKACNLSYNFDIATPSNNHNNLIQFPHRSPV